MAAKKTAKTAFSYGELFLRCPDNQKPKLNKLLQLNRKYNDQLNSLPSEPPKINWEFYKNNVRTEFVSMIEEFEKKYKSFEIPRPIDKYTDEILKQEEETKCDIEVFINESNERIKEIENKIEMIKNVPAFDEMTLEMFADYYPDYAADFINRPTFWPHSPEEQPPGLLKGIPSNESDKSDCNNNDSNDNDSNDEESNKKH